MAHYLKLTVKGLCLSAAGLTRGGILPLILFCGCATAAAQTAGPVELLSINAAGSHAGNGPSTIPKSSADGRFVVFESEASDLAPNDTNGAGDIFVRDVQAGATSLVSVNVAGTASGNGQSFNASITPDGRFVVFDSAATDLVATNDANGEFDVFVRDLVAKTTTLVSVNAAGTASGSRGSVGGVVTPDGRFVVFDSTAADLAAGVSPGAENVFRRDLQTGSTVLVSANAAGTNGGNNTSSALAVTPDGRYVLFISSATNLGGNDTNGIDTDIFRRDLQTNTTALVSVNRTGSGSGDGPSFSAVMSDDGQVVAFTSEAKDLVAGDNNGTFTSIYARDFKTKATTLVSEKQVIQGLVPIIAPASAPRISADGRYVIYERADSLGPASGPPDPKHDKVLRRDRQTGTLLLLSNVKTGVCNSSNCRSQIGGVIASADGRYVAYSQAEFPNGSGPPPMSTAIVLRDVEGGGYEVVPGFTDYTGEHSDLLNITAGNIASGPKLTFSSGADRSDNDTNGAEDVYLFTPTHVGKIGFVKSPYPGFERGDASIEVRRQGLFLNSTEGVHYATSAGTATAGVDYTDVSGVLTFGPGETSKTFAIPIREDNVREPDETVNLTLDSPTGGATLGDLSASTMSIRDDDLHELYFQSFSTDVSEKAGSVAITVLLLGDPATGPVSVDYATSDGTASARGDYVPAFGRLDFALGETRKTFNVLINDDAFVEEDETILVDLSNPTGGAVIAAGNSTARIVIKSDDSAPPTSNPLDRSDFFVAQHYHDFLGREPDAAGLAFWTNEIEKCGADARCREVKRVNVSAAFFLSIEFQQTGYLAYKTYGAAFGATRVGSNAPLTIDEFLRDTQAIGRNVVVGNAGWETRLQSNKTAYFDDFVSRPDFTTAYPSAMTAAQYVDALNANAGGALSASERAQLVTALTAGTKTRAQVLRAVAEDADFTAAQFRRAFVLMQYFGYLRRNPSDPPDADYSGYNFWLSKLNSFSGDYVRAEMVKAFISSGEYRRRFGQ